jgi:hypothetical protein
MNAMDTSSAIIAPILINKAYFTILRAIYRKQCFHHTKFLNYSKKGAEKNSPLFCLYQHAGLFIIYASQQFP